MKKFPYKIIDLTHTLNKDSPAWNLGSCGFKHETKLDYDDCHEEVKFRVQQIKIHAGIGTHIDAPAHCIRGGKTVEELELEDLISPAYCIDISKEATASTRLSEQDILAFEKEHGYIQNGSFVICYTGWSKYWFDAKLYHNNYKFPSIDKEAAELLVQRGVVGVGIDTLSPDLPSSGFPVHNLILGSGKYIVENIANADKIPAKGAFILIAPIKGDGLTEAPVRLVGLIAR